MKEWVVSVTLRPHLTPYKDPIPIVQEAVVIVVYFHVEVSATS